MELAIDGWRRSESSVKASNERMCGVNDRPGLEAEVLEDGRKREIGIALKHTECVVFLGAVRGGM